MTEEIYTLTHWSRIRTDEKKNVIPYTFNIDDERMDEKT